MGIINFKKIIGDAGKEIIVRANPIKDSEGMELLQEGRPLPGPWNGSSISWKWTVQGDMCWDSQSKRLCWEGTARWRAAGRGELGRLLHHVAHSLGFMGLVSVLSAASCSDSGFFLVVHALLSQDGFQWGGFWEVGRTYGISFDLSQILPFGSGLLVPCTLPGPSVVKLLMQIIIMVSGQGGWFQLVFPWQNRSRDTRL